MNAGRCGACDFDYGTVDPPDVPERLAPAIDRFRRELHNHDARVLRRPAATADLETAGEIIDAAAQLLPNLGYF